MPRPRQPWQPSTDDYTRAILDSNPWWLDGNVPKALARPHQRPLAKHLWHRLCDDNNLRRFHLVLGPRRVGKTTCLYQTVRHLLANGIAAQRVLYLSLDHPLLMPVRLDEMIHALLPKHADRASPVWFLLDEIVAAKDWDRWLKTMYDQQWPVNIVASASATAALRDRSLESGVGRWEEHYLGPCLFDEYLSLSRRVSPVLASATLSETIAAALDEPPSVHEASAQLENYMLTGGFPELLLSDTDADAESRLLRSQRVLRDQAIERAIYKDIPQVYNIDNPPVLERLAYVLAAQITGLLSPTTIAKDLRIAVATVDKYISYLERSFLVFVLPNYAPNNERSVQKRGRKVYFSDGAVRNAALQRGLAPLNDPEERGLLYENLAAAHLNALAQQANVRLHYWRDGGCEVDLVLSDPAQPLAFEIASSPSHHRDGLRAFIDRYPQFRHHCYVVAPAAPPASAQTARDGIGTIPLWLFLLCVGAQNEAALAARMGAVGSLFDADE